MPSPDIQEPPARLTRLALIALIGGAVCIGLSPILVRVSELGPVATAFYRVWLGLPLMWIWMLHERRRQGQAREHTISGRERMLLLLPGLFFAGDLGFWHWSIELTTVANATLLCNLAPIHVTLVATLLFGERFNRTFLIALVLAIGGAAILMGASTTFGGDFVTGDILALVTSVFYAAYLLTVGRMRTRHATVTIMFWSSLMAGLVLLPLSMLDGSFPLPQTVTGWSVLFVLALVSHLGGQGLIAWALAHLSTAFTALSLLLQPVVSALLAWWLFAEVLGPVQWLGGLVILAAIYLARQATLR